MSILIIQKGLQYHTNPGPYRQLIISIRGGHSNMEELFSTMGVQPIDIKSFQKIELKLGKVKNYKFMFIEILH
jgi:hypothetical protein